MSCLSIRGIWLIPYTIIIHFYIFTSARNLPGVESVSRLFSHKQETSWGYSSIYSLLEKRGWTMPYREVGEEHRYSLRPYEVFISRALSTTWNILSSSAYWPLLPTASPACFQLSLSSAPFWLRVLPSKAATVQTLNHIQVEVEDGHAMSTIDPIFVTRAFVQGTGQINRELSTHVLHLNDAGQQRKSTFS